MTATFTWPGERLGEALSLLARRCDLSTAASLSPSPSSLASIDVATLHFWMHATAQWLGIHVEITEVSYPTCDLQVAAAAPLVARLRTGCFLVLVDGRTALGPDNGVHRIAREDVRRLLFEREEASAAPGVGRILERAHIAPARRGRASAEILRTRLAGARATECWIVRSRPETEFRTLLSRVRLPERICGLFAAHAVEYALWLLSWWFIGAGALEGRLDIGSLQAWALLLLSTIPVRAVATWLEGMIAISAGGLLKERLLYGALRLDPDEIRHLGAGQLTGRVLESQSLENLALSGGFLAITALVEVVASAVVLALGAGGVPHSLALIGWIVLTLILARRYWRTSREWAGNRLSLTGDLIEHMVGHRTRLAQENKARWHDAEDQGLSAYMDVSARMDRDGGLLAAVAARGWLVIGALGIAPAFVNGAPTPGSLAAAIGGVLIGFQGLKKLASGLWHLVGAAIAWEQIAPLHRAATRPLIHGSPAAVVRRNQDGGPVIEAEDLVFGYGDHRRAVLQGTSIRISRGERVLLEGPSGGGKSTLASLLAGLRKPASGLLLLNGLDNRTWGLAGWRQRVASAPQFHENFVFTGTFLFNILLSRAGPQTEEDAEEAQALCSELGLDGLIERMPSGMMQQVGEGGWQLSHGERSRLYMARALMQRTELVVIDESFAALDPENLDLAMECAFRHADTLFVIAHR